jgi:hypothetical protein
MKAIKLFLPALTFCTLQVVAQTNNTAASSIVGTWTETTDTLREIKIISPTHVFFMVFNKDSFLYAGAGTYTVEGNKYTEHMQYANFDFSTMKGFTFDYDVQGDKFMQKGTLTMPDGSQAPINHTFTRVKSDKAYDGAHVGTWNQLSSTYTDTSGTKHSHTNATHIRFQIVTPTHWMRISMRENKFENAMEGTYTMDGNKWKVMFDNASFPASGLNVDITSRQEGNKMYWSGTVKDASGRQTNQFEDVFERVDGK